MRGKMNRSFCTICTQSHLNYVLALHESLQQFEPDVVLNALVVDGLEKPDLPNLHVFHFTDIGPAADPIRSKYHHDPDRLRWASKPLFLNYLLKAKDHDAVVYVDCDISFFNDFSFLFDLLRDHAILLSPHRRGVFPYEKFFLLNFMDGFFNAGFIGASKKGLPALHWWQECCEFRVEKNYEDGCFDDQKYLDLLPLLFPGVHVLEHQGCNIANWNKETCQRALIDDKVLINAKWPIIFVHFARTLINDIQASKDPLLKAYYDVYVERVRKFEPFGRLKKENISGPKTHQAVIQAVEQERGGKREDFLRFLPKNSLGAELGVFRGAFSKKILEIVNPQKLHLIDAWWLAYGEIYPWKDKETNDGTLTTKTAYNEVLAVIKECDRGDRCLVHISDDITSLKTFDDGYFDWVYIDTDHSYERTKNELLLLRHKVKADGVICGHDWQPDTGHRHHGVYKAVNEFCGTYGYNIIKLDAHLQWAIKRKGV